MEEDKIFFPSPDCVDKVEHNLRTARKIEYPAFMVCVDCGAKFYLVHETLFFKIGITVEGKS